MIVTLGGVDIWTLMDLIKILCQEFKDKDGNKLAFKTFPTNDYADIIDKINKVYNNTIRTLFGYKVNDDDKSWLRASSIYAKITQGFVVIISILSLTMIVIKVINTSDYIPFSQTSSASSKTNR